MAISWSHSGGSGWSPVSINDPLNLLFFLNYAKIVLKFYQKWNFAVLVGEIANFIAYMFAPAVLVTPLGALSIIVRYSGGCLRWFVLNVFVCF